MCLLQSLGMAHRSACAFQKSRCQTLTTLRRWEAEMMGQLPMQLRNDHEVEPREPGEIRQVDADVQGTANGMETT